MPSRFRSLAPLMMLLVLGCSEVDADECWVNTSGGFGGGGTIPIGSGVGASSSGAGFSPPPEGPLDYSGEPNPCMAEESDQGTESGSCPNSVDITEGAYTYCSGQCADKCPTGGVHGFSPSIFKFSTIVPDDGTGPGGGWQEAVGTMFFFRWISWEPERWKCIVKVGMPLRTEVNGKISAQTAATITAGVATEASFTITNIKPEVPQGIYCFKLKEEMRALFKKPALSSYGATVMPL